MKRSNKRKTLYTQHSQTQVLPQFRGWRKLPQQKTLSVLSDLQALLEVFAQTYRIRFFQSIVHKLVQ